MKFRNTVSALVALMVVLVWAPTAYSEESRPLSTLITSADSMSAEELSIVGQNFCSNSYYVSRAEMYVNFGELLCAVGKLETKSGHIYQFPELVPPGETITRGLVCNFSQVTAEFLYGPTDEHDMISLPHGSMMAVGFLIGENGFPVSGGPQSCDVACGAGFWSCCNFGTDSYPTCQCVSVTNINTTVCKTGGAGAVSCRLTQSPPPQSPPHKKVSEVSSSE